MFQFNYFLPYITSGVIFCCKATNENFCFLCKIKLNRMKSFPLAGRTAASGKPLGRAGGVQMETFIPWTLVKRGVRREIITPLDAPQAFTVEAVAERTKRKAAQNTPLIRALGLAHYWQRLLDEGRAKTIADIAAAESIDVTQARRVLRLRLLAPAVVEKLLAETDMSINLEAVLRRAIPRDWREQSVLWSR